MNDHPKTLSDPDDDTDLTPEIRAIIGIHHLYAHIRASIDARKLDDGLTDAARRLLIRLDRPQRMGELARVTQLFRRR